MYKKIINYSKIKNKIKYPDFLKNQIKFFKKFINIKTINKKKKGIYKIFKNIFPIYNKKKNIYLNFINYYIDYPNNSIKECIKKGLTYNVNIRIKLQLVNKKENKKYIQKVYFGTCPYMTNNGSFIFNGTERVIVFQLYRSPGIFFGSFYHFNGMKLYYTRIIPLKGSWIEFVIDINNIINVYIDRKKKIPLIIFLKSLGYKKKKYIFEILGLCKKKKISNKIINKINFLDIKNNNLILIKKNKILNKEDINLLKKNNIKYIYIKKKLNKNNIKFKIINNTLLKNYLNSYEKSIFYLYKKLKNSFPPNIKIAKKVIKKNFYNKKKYNLGKVGRYKINKKLNLNIPYKFYFLTKKDLIYIIKNLINLLNYKKEIDDVDHLSNRRVKTVYDQLYQLFNIGLSRMSKIIKDKLNLIDKNKIIKPNELINSRILSSVINTFFGTSQLSQFMEKTNPLSEITHKRRLTLLGPGGLIRNRAGFEARDVNYSHYGRLCPIETPEGPNIGLISSLCLFTKINNMGFLETPYKKIKNKKIKNKIIYLTSEEENNKIIIPFNTKINNKKIIARKNSDYILTNIKKINYIDYSYNQIISISAGLIPFLENDDANRALMGSNMMRQAVPLLKLELPIVGTGLEKKIIYYSRNFIKAKEKGLVKYVDSKNIIIKYYFKKKKKKINFYKKYYKYKLIKFKKTNQNTCLNLKPIVKKNEIVKKNQIICEGFANKNGELALGKNLLVAFMSWKGYNFEDAILVSNRIIREDYFTSIHIDEFSLESRFTKFGKEKLTNDIPNISDKLKNKLDKNGIIKIGNMVEPGDILIGKITPKENNNNSPEEKLLKSIFGEKASNVKDSSLRAHSSLYGLVIDTKIFTKKNNKIKNKEKILKYKKKYIKKKKNIYKRFFKKLYYLLKKYKIKKNKIKKNKYIYKKIINLKKKDKILIKKLFVNFNIIKNKLYNKYKNKKIKIILGNNLPNGVIKIAKVYIIKKRKLKIGDKMSGRHGNKGVISKIVRDEDMPFLEDGTVIDIVLNPLSVPSRMNIGQVLESILGYIGYKMKKRLYNPIFNGITLKEINKKLKKLKINNYCRYNLYDGQSGEKFNKKITIGIIYMLKLNHMVDDKMHARSIGPYSLITQQPLGGKSQFGGQRFGEMEVWALEAFGASNILSELLTIKSDDIKGRSKTYEAIVKGKKIPKPSIPESFNVLINELKGLCLNIELKK
ncbi:MAG: DNA-directed RNA polymerase subunit beta [Candidatus Shikimatogenerans bostrichidophilus]|nr:MAG: DNA-directed RNA polymerase subunit beta [Candidatus Shikimatogenerans bostrichidophilus]